MDDDAADRQCVLQPAAKRNRVSGGDPAAAILRSGGGCGLQLWRDRCGDRPRDDAWLRRPGRALRADRQFRGMVDVGGQEQVRSEEHTSELQSLMRISYAVFCLKNKKTHIINPLKLFISQ